MRRDPVQKAMERELRRQGTFTCSLDPGESARLTACACGAHVFTLPKLRFVRAALDGKPYVIIPDPLERRPGTP